MTHTRKVWLWVAGALLAAAAAALFATSGLGAQAEPVPQATASPAPTPMLELAPIDVVRARVATLRDELPITGSLRAVRTAMVKTNVAATVSELRVSEGDAVRQGEVLARLDATEYRARQRQAQQNLAAAQAQRDIAQRTLDNNQALVRQGFISRTALENSTANLATAQAQVEAARAAADLADKAVADTVLRAPMSGLVSQRLVQPGERLGVDGRVLELVDLSALELDAAVPADRVLAVAIGAQARLQVEGGGEVSATVVRINPGTQPGTRAVMTYLRIEDPAGLRQGLFARGHIELASREALLLPLSAVRIDRSRPYVLALQDGVAVARDVRTGLRGRSEGQEVVEIVDGLADGTLVLSGSVGTVRTGTRVRLPAGLDAGG